MKDYKWGMSAMWLCTTLAVLLGLYITRKASCILFLLIPAIVSIEYLGGGKNDDP